MATGNMAARIWRSLDAWFLSYTHMHTVIVICDIAAGSEVTKYVGMM